MPVCSTCLACDDAGLSSSHLGTGVVCPSSRSGTKFQTGRTIWKHRQTAATIPRNLAACRQLGRGQEITQYLNKIIATFRYNTFGHHLYRIERAMDGGDLSECHTSIRAIGYSGIY